MERLEGRGSPEEDLNALERGLCLMSVMDMSGDHRLTWDPLDPQQVTKARAEFDRLRKAGYTAFRLNLIDQSVKGQKADTFNRWDGELIMEFDEVPQHTPSQVLLAPPLQGG